MSLPSINTPACHTLIVTSFPPHIPPACPRPLSTRRHVISCGASTLCPPLLPAVALDRAGMYHIQNASTPTLMFHGIDDPRMPISQSFQLHYALLQQGIPVRFLTFPGSGHIPGTSALSMTISRALSHALVHALSHALALALILYPMAIPFSPFLCFWSRSVSISSVVPISRP